ncbi:adenosylhomocysteinase [Bartonella melophagi]|uniref:adenosylhomocysteinase n=1 Tax=Bartonella melophagi TaxID=291176 RepID=UPI0018DB4BCB
MICRKEFSSNQPLSETYIFCTENYKNKVIVLPKYSNEKVAYLYLDRLEIKSNVLLEDISHLYWSYLQKPYKPNHNRY